MKTGIFCGRGNLWMARPFVRGVVVVEVSADPAKPQRVWRVVLYDPARMGLDVMKFAALHAGVQGSCACTSVSREGKFCLSA